MKIRQLRPRHQEADRTRYRCGARDQAAALKREDHVVNRWRSYLEVLLNFRFCRRPSVDFCVVVNERKVLPLLGGIGALRRALSRIPEGLMLIGVRR